MIKTTELFIIERGDKSIIRPEHYGSCYKKELKNIPAKILKKLLEKPNELVPYEDIVEEVWSLDSAGIVRHIRALDVHLVKIKRFISECDLDYQILRARRRGLVLVTIDKYRY